MFLWPRVERSCAAARCSFLKWCRWEKCPESSLSLPWTELGATSAFAETDRTTACSGESWLMKVRILIDDVR